MTPLYRFAVHSTEYGYEAMCLFDGGAGIRRWRPVANFGDYLYRCREFVDHTAIKIDAKRLNQLADLYDGHPVQEVPHRPGQFIPNLTRALQW